VTGVSSICYGPLMIARSGGLLLIVRFSVGGAALHIGKLAHSIKDLLSSIVRIWVILRTFLGPARGPKPLRALATSFF
jgi:hypothetical protein